jgi:two-component system OmpR family sensor kinase
VTRSLTARVVALVALVAVASAAVTAAAIARAIRDANRQRVAATLALSAENLAGQVERGRPVRQALTTARLTRQGVEVAVVPPGQVPPPPFAAADAGPETDPVVRTSGDVQYLVVGRPTSDGRVVLLARPLAQATGLAPEQRRQVLLGAGIVLVVGVLGGLLLARGVTGPLRRVAAAAGRLTAGERDVRVGRSGPTEVAEVGAALDALAERLAESEDRQRRFLLAVGHELRTPLTAVTGYAEALAEGVLPADEVPRAGGVVLAEARRLQARVDDLMALARVQADDFELVPAVTDLSALLRSAGAACVPRAREAGVTVHVEGADGPVLAWADGERVRQVVDALVDNALRVLPAGAPLVLACGAADGWAFVQVRDGGPGLAPADLAVAFEPGRLTERYRGERPVGTGLGLALVGQLAARMGGRALAAAAPEGGVAFTVQLPSGR